MTDDKAREAICTLGASIFNRGLTAGSSGNISMRVDGGWLMTPTNASLGRLDPARLSKLDDNGKLLGGDAPIHPPAVITRGQKIAKSVENLGLDSLRQLVAPPRFADQAFSALAVAVGDEHAGERQAPPGACRIPGQKAAHGGGVAPVGP